MAKNTRKIKVLITAGPTWVKLDRVRILTNIFSGRTGLLIAQAFSKRGFRARLLLGPSRLDIKNTKFEIKRFRYFDELKDLLSRELKDKSIKAIIHSAAVSDYEPYKVHSAKIPSSKKTLVVRLKPTTKLISRIKRKRRDIFLIQFKLEVGRKRKELINRAYASLVKNSSDLVVANDLDDFKGLSFKSYIIDKDKNVALVKNRKALASKLVTIVADSLS
jgi:phosphopantothenoylcysteine synthetase/decarboxylase